MDRIRTRFLRKRDPSPVVATGVSNEGGLFVKGRTVVNEVSTRITNFVNPRRHINLLGQILPSVRSTEGNVSIGRPYG